MNDLLHSFPGQDSNEPVFVFARPYFLAYIPTLLLFIIIFFFSLLGQFAFTNLAFPGLSPDVGNIGILSLGVFQLLTVVAFMITVFDFYYSIVVVTDRRLVDIDQQQLFFRRISELTLEEIEDVTSVVKGFWQSTFDYGTVLIETAGRQEQFIIDNIRFPREVTALILNLSQQTKQGVPEGARYPKTNVIGVINNHPLSTLPELQKMGVLFSQTSMGAVTGNEAD